MEKEVISIQQATFLVIMLLLGTSLIVAGGVEAHQDAWMAILISIFVMMPAAFVYGKLISLFPGKNLFQILEIAFGKVFGKFISILYISYFVYLGSLCIRNITEFLQVASIHRTPQLFTALCIGSLAIYMVKSGLEVLARWNKLVLIFIFVLLFIINVSSIPKFNYENLRPILYKGWGPVLSNTFMLSTFPFGEIVIFLSMFHSLRDHKKAVRVLFIGLLVGGLLFLMTDLRNTFLLGFPNLGHTYFPTYYANSIISIGGVIQGIELLTSIILVLTGFTKVCICLFGSCIGVQELFNSKDYSSYSPAIGILMIIISLVIYENTMAMFEGAQIYKYIALPFQIIFPPIILLFGWKKTKTQKGL